jgi:hypothetical protein
MLQQLHELINGPLPGMLENPDMWKSLIVNRRYPHTYRVYHNLPNGNRICLHRFDKFADGEAFYHPHPWPGAFLVLDGKYQMKVGFAKDRESPPQDVMEEMLSKGSAYSITNPLTFHSVVPLDTTYTVMLNGPVFAPDVIHAEARTTKGKDLDRMPHEDVLRHLTIFRELLANNRWSNFCDWLSS